MIDIEQAWMAVRMNGDDRHPHLSNAMLSSALKPGLVQYRCRHAKIVDGAIEIYFS
jgi:hypothetical protein